MPQNYYGKKGRMVGRMDREKDRQINRWRDGRTNGQIDGQTYGCEDTSYVIKDSFRRRQIDFVKLVT